MNLGCIWEKLDSIDRTILCHAIEGYSGTFSNSYCSKNLSLISNGHGRLVFFDIRLCWLALKGYNESYRNYIQTTGDSVNRDRIDRMIKLLHEKYIENEL